MNYQHICLFSYDDRTVCRAYRDQVIGELVVGGKVQLKWPTSGDSYEIYNARILGMCETKQRGEKMGKEFLNKLGAHDLDHLEPKDIDVILNTLTTDDKENKTPTEKRSNSKKRKVVSPNQDAAQVIINMRAAAQQSTTQSYATLSTKSKDKSLNQSSPIPSKDFPHTSSQFSGTTSQVVSSALKTIYDNEPTYEPMLQQLESPRPYVANPVQLTSTVPTSERYVHSTQSFQTVPPSANYTESQTQSCAIASPSDVQSLAHAFSTVPPPGHYSQSPAQSSFAVQQSDCYMQSPSQCHSTHFGQSSSRSSHKVPHSGFYNNSLKQSNVMASTSNHPNLPNQSQTRSSSLGQPLHHIAQSPAHFAQGVPTSEHFTKPPAQTLPFVPSSSLHDVVTRIEQLEEDFKSIKSQMQSLTLRKDQLEARGNVAEQIFHSGLTKADVKDGIAVRSKLKDAVKFAMESVFTPDELSKCSLFGRNTSRRRVDMDSVRPALDQGRYLIIEGLLAEKFDNIADIRDKMRNRLKLSRGKFGNLEPNDDEPTEN